MVNPHLVYNKRSTKEESVMKVEKFYSPDLFGPDSGIVGLMIKAVVLGVPAFVIAAVLFSTTAHAQCGALYRTVESGKCAGTPQMLFPPEAASAASAPERLRAVVIIGPSSFGSASELRSQLAKCSHVAFPDRDILLGRLEHDELTVDDARILDAMRKICLVNQDKL
jgi:hypothetical protein